MANTAARHKGGGNAGRASLRESLFILNCSSSCCGTIHTATSALPPVQGTPDRPTHHLESSNPLYEVILPTPGRLASVASHDPAFRFPLPGPLPHPLELAEAFPRLARTARHRGIEGTVGTDREGLHNLVELLACVRPTSHKRDGVCQNRGSGSAARGLGASWLGRKKAPGCPRDAPRSTGGLARDASPGKAWSRFHRWRFGRKACVLRPWHQRVLATSTRGGPERTIVSPQVLEHPVPCMHRKDEPPVCVRVLLVLLHMRRHDLDLLRPDCNLDFGRAGVAWEALPSPDSRL
eukprot:scaffold3717_cov124-Isochrysis_galbana.AAC.4